MIFTFCNSHFYSGQSWHASSPSIVLYLWLGARRPTANVGYTSFLKDELEKLGHFVSLSFTNWKETLKNLEKIIIADEVLRQKDAHLEDLAPNNKRAFVSKWMNDHPKFCKNSWVGSSIMYLFLTGFCLRPRLFRKPFLTFRKRIYGWCMPFEFWKVYVVFLLWRNCEF